MYASNNIYATKHRSDGGYIATESLDLSKSVYLEVNLDRKKFCIKVDLPSKYIDIPLSSMSRLNKWFAEKERKN